MTEIKELKRLARFRPVQLPNGFTYRFEKMTTEQIEARRKYVRQRLSPYEDKLPRMRFDNDTIDMTLIIESDEFLLVSMYDEKWKSTYDHIIDKASWDKMEDIKK